MLKDGFIKKKIATTFEIENKTKMKTSVSYFVAENDDRQ